MSAQKPTGTWELRDPAPAVQSVASSKDTNRAAGGNPTPDVIFNTGDYGTPNTTSASENGTGVNKATAEESTGGNKTIAQNLPQFTITDVERLVRAVGSGRTGSGIRYILRITLRMKGRNCRTRREWLDNKEVVRTKDRGESFGRTD